MKLLSLLPWPVFSSLALAAPSFSALPKRQSTGTNRPSNYTIYTFDQPIDHFQNISRYEPHTNATFQQNYVFDNTYYQPGGPIFLYIGGETDISSRFDNLQTGIIQILMNATNGLGIILENRYYGGSYPFNTSSTDDLRFLTTEQTIADNAYFAQHVNLPGINQSINAPDTPWILYGGSLAGAQTAFSLVEYHGLLWGGIASSGVIHAMKSYPQWYAPIQKLGPSDCISDINAIIDKMDSLVAANNTAAIQQLKEIFGLGQLTDIRDFAMTIAFPLGGPLSYPTNTWQELNGFTVYDAPDFFYFCNNVTDANAPANVTSVDYALSNYTNGEPWTGLGNYAAYVQNVIVSMCPSPDLIDTTACFSTQNQTRYADITNYDGRSYLYTTCTENGYYQVAPSVGPSLVSRVLQDDYSQQWCTWAFPPGQYNTIPTDGPDVSRWNKYGSFNMSAPNLAFIDGNADVWKDVCYHSDIATHISTPPGETLRQEADLGLPRERYGQDQYLIAGGGHHWDSYGILDLDAEPDFIQAAHRWEIRTVQRWLKDFANKNSQKRRDEL